MTDPFDPRTDTALRQARIRLQAAGIPDPARDAQVLLRAAGAGHADTLSPEVAALFDSYVARRAAREPVSHITGRRAFWRHDFLVTPDVLDPRPDTETLVEAAIACAPRRVLDLGTGSGCILASVLADCPEATGLGTDVSQAALDVARRNLEIAGVTARADLCPSDWFDAVTGHYDLIVSNPPYIAQDEMQALSPEVLREPHLALTPGGDGLDAYRRITGAARTHLTPGGRLMVEIGAGQATAVRALFEAAGFGKIAAIDDLNGKNRIISGDNA